MSKRVTLLVYIRCLPRRRCVQSPGSTRDRGRRATLRRTFQSGCEKDRTGRTYVHPTGTSGRQRKARCHDALPSPLTELEEAPEGQRLSISSSTSHAETSRSIALRSTMRTASRSDPPPLNSAAVEQSSSNTLSDDVCSSRTGVNRMVDGQAPLEHGSRRESRLV